MEETIKLCVKAVISPRDRDIRKLMREYEIYKKVLISRTQQAVRQVVKDRTITVYSQQKWMVDRKLTRYLNNLPLHPMPFHNQSVWIENQNGYFLIHFKTKQEGEAVCHLKIPLKYRGLIEKACGKNNTILGQVELKEDHKYGWINVHIVLRLPKPEPYAPKGWIGVDVGWNNLAVSTHFNKEGKISNVTFHGKLWKTRIIQLKYLLRQYQRANRSWVKWNFRLKHVTKYTVGCIAKEIVEKAKRLHAGVAIEKLNFRSSTKRWLIPRYKLRTAIKNLCERQGTPFMEVPARNTSITCNRCGYIDKMNRNGKIFHCRKCGYKINADLNASVNIAKEAILTSYKLVSKEARLYAKTSGEVATPLSPNER